MTQKKMALSFSDTSKYGLTMINSSKRRKERHSVMIYEFSIKFLIAVMRVKKTNRMT